VRKQVPNSRFGRAGRIVEAEGALLDRNQRGVCRQQLRHRGELEDVLLRTVLPEHVPVSGHDGNGDGVDRPVPYRLQCPHARRL
jgi:hypothetical protein